MANIELTENDLNKIFPFILILSKDFEISLIGRSLAKLYPQLKINTNFYDNFRIIGPNNEYISNVDFENLQSKLVMIENISFSQVKLKGHFEKLDNTENIQEKEIKNETLKIDLKDKRILIAEDNEMNIEVLKKILKPYNPILTTVKNGQEAINICKKELFDLILMYIQMPIVDGIEATKTLKQIVKIATPIIAVSANAFKNEIDKCFKAGMSNYIIKPYEEQNLLQIIQKEINKKKMKNYDLDKLIKMSNNDTIFISKMTSLFIKNSLETIINLENALNNKKMLDIKKEIHKIKPSLSNMSISILDNDIKIIENYKLNIISKEVKNSVLNLNKNLNLVIEELKRDTINKVK
jgi:CheY-like chemotaxis protein